MADTHLALANRALQRLGADPITSLTTTVDTSQRALVMSALMESTRRTALGAHNWNFAATRRTLDRFMCAPVFGLGCSYLLPSDYITVHETDLDEPDAYRIENHVCAHNNTCNMVLVTDSTCAPSILYTSDITDITKWHPLFTTALEIQLAADAAIALGKSGNLQESLDRKAQIAWRQARSRDGQEGRPKKSWLSSSLLWARRGYDHRPDQVNFE
jgi:hypothetical protein